MENIRKKNIFEVVITPPDKKTLEALTRCSQMYIPIGGLEKKQLCEYLGDYSFKAMYNCNRTEATCEKGCDNYETLGGGMLCNINLLLAYWRLELIEYK